MESIGTPARVMGAGAFASTAYPTSNLAIYTPFYLRGPILVTKLYALNGATASNNIDLGIYDEYGTRIVSTGSTARSGANVVQSIDITDTLIGPGRFYMALAQNGTTGTFAAINATTPGPARAKICGIYQQTTAFPLPANATFATYAQTNFYLPQYGLLVGPTTLI